MKSRTLFCNGTALKKDITRFAPAWLLYGLLLVVVVLSFLDPGYSYQEVSKPYQLTQSLYAMGFIVCAYGLLNAQLLFGDLYKSRMTNALHALPLRRETWFGTHVTAGILFGLVPNLVVAVVCTVLLDELQIVAWYWFLAVTLQYLFYFGLAAFSALCAGSRFALAVVYCLCSFGAWLLYWVANSLYVPLMPGISIAFALFSPFCPVIYGLTHIPITVEVKRRDFYPYEITSQSLVLDGESWTYLAVIAVIGIVLLAAALVMYRRRHLESAGNFIAVNWLKPVFLVSFTLALGALSQYLLSFAGSMKWLYLVIGLIVGYFAGQMFLQRTIRVLNKRTLAGFAAFAAVLMGTLGLTALDVMDLEHWVPDPQHVDNVLISSVGHWDYVGNTDEAMIRDVAHLHQTLLEEENGDLEPIETTTVTYENEYFPEDSYTTIYYTNGYNITIRYTLDFGVTLTRTYTRPYSSGSTQELIAIMTRPEQVLVSYTSDLYRNQEAAAGSLRILYQENHNQRYYYPPEADARALIDALVADCEAGTMAQYSGFHEGTGYELTLRWGTGTQTGYSSISITIYPEAEHTMAWLEGQEFYQQYLKNQTEE